ncbi:MAG: hypothetical protein ACFCU9_14915 [Cyanophyceae cyanobacterium]
MNFKYPSVALLSVFLLVSGCGEPENAPALPGAVQVSGDDFVLAREYRFTPGSVLETNNLRLDFINPRFNGIPVRNSSSQGSGEARIQNLEATIEPLDASLASDSLAILIGRSNPIMPIVAVAPDDAELESAFSLAGLTLRAGNINDQRIRVGTNFTVQESVGGLPVPTPAIPVEPTPDPESEDGQLPDGPGSPQRPNPPSQIVDTNLTLTVENIYVSNNGETVVIEGSANLRGIAQPLINTITGEVLAPEPVVSFEAGRFSASFNVRSRGVAGDGSGDDALALLSRLNFVPNQAELVYRPTQSGTASVLFAPDPQRPNVLNNQLVRIRRLLNGRIEAEFDPANISTVLNFVQVAPPPGSFPTPIPQLPIEGEEGEGEPIPVPGPPTAFDYFFSLRTERPDGGDDPIQLVGFVPTTGDFIFRNLAGSQLGGPFNRADIGGGLQRGNLNLVFSQTTNSEAISGEWFLEQEFPTDDGETGPSPLGNILIIRGSFTGTPVRL